MKTIKKIRYLDLVIILVVFFLKILQCQWIKAKFYLAKNKLKILKI